MAADQDRAEWVVFTQLRPGGNWEAATAVCCGASLLQCFAANMRPHPWSTRPVSEPRLVPPVGRGRHAAAAMSLPAPFASRSIRRSPRVLPVPPNPVFYGENIQRQGEKDKGGKEPDVREILNTFPGVANVRAVPTRWPGECGWEVPSGSGRGLNGHVRLISLAPDDCRITAPVIPATRRPARGLLIARLGRTLGTKAPRGGCRVGENEGHKHRSARMPCHRGIPV